MIYIVLVKITSQAVPWDHLGPKWTCGETRSVTCDRGGPALFFDAFLLQ